MPSVQRSKGQSDLQGSVYAVQSDKDTQFIGPIVVNTLRLEDLGPLPMGGNFCWILGAQPVYVFDPPGFDPKCDIWFFSSATGQDADLDLDTYLGMMRFSKAFPSLLFNLDANFNLYTASRLSSPLTPELPHELRPIPYRTDDGRFHVGLVPRFGGLKLDQDFSLRLLVSLHRPAAYSPGWNMCG